MSTVATLKDILKAEISSSSRRKWIYQQELLTEDDFLPALPVIFVWNGLDWKGLKDVLVKPPCHGQGAFH